MSERHDEDLYAFLDGELDGHRSRFLLKRFSHDRDLEARWHRAQLVRAVLHGERRHDLSGFTRRVTAAIAAEAEPEAATAALAGRWLRPAAGLAVAASVALVAFAALQPVTTTPGPETVAEPVAAPVAPLVDRSEVPLNYAVSQRAQVASGARLAGAQTFGNPRVQAYLLRHNEMAAPRATRSLVPYVYLVSAPPGNAPARDDQDPPEDGAADDAATQPARP